MRYCSVASGSSGNCHFVEAGGVRVLVELPYFHRIFHRETLHGITSYVD